MSDQLQYLITKVTTKEKEKFEQGAKTSHAHKQEEKSMKNEREGRVERFIHNYYIVYTFNPNSIKKF